MKIIIALVIPLLVSAVAIEKILSKYSSAQPASSLYSLIVVLIHANWVSLGQKIEAHQNQYSP
jgi:hypothetical protein